MTKIIRFIKNTISFPFVYVYLFVICPIKQAIKNGGCFCEYGFYCMKKVEEFYEDTESKNKKEEV